MTLHFFSVVSLFLTSLLISMFQFESRVSLWSWGVTSCWSWLLEIASPMGLAFTVLQIFHRGDVVPVTGPHCLLF